jgi:hypothetical protein
LNPVSLRELADNFAVGRDAVKSFGVIGDVLAVLLLDCELIILGIRGNDGGVGATLDS